MTANAVHWDRSILNVQNVVGTTDWSRCKRETTGTRCTGAGGRIGSGIQNCHPEGAGGHHGLGSHPRGGVQVGSVGVSHPGGALNVGTVTFLVADGWHASAERQVMAVN